jgi:hypothetical protein
MNKGFSRRDTLRATAAVFAGAAFSGSLLAGDDAPDSTGLEPAEGRPKVPQPVLAYDALVLLEQEISHGKSPYGERYRVPIIGGEFAGPGIKGRVVPGGVDWQLVRADGYWVIDADYFMETDDKVQIHVHNVGLWYDADGDGIDEYCVTTPVLEAPMGKYGWLNQHIFCGTIANGLPDTPSVRLAIYKLV